MKQFDKDLEESRKTEHQLEDRLKYMGYQTSNTQHLNYFTGYDVVAWIGTNTGHTTTYEVKLDRMASTTGNIAVEACKVIDGKKQPSGLTATKADYYCYTVPPDNTFYVINTTILKNMIKNQEYSIVVDGGDGYRSKLCLFPKDYFLSKCTRM